MKLPPGHVAGVGVHKATAYGGFGQKMLEKMGWSKGQGLGKEKHGMKEAIEVKKKEDSLGVGATSSGWKWDWKYWEDAYNTGLQSMEKNSGSKKRRRQSTSSDSSSSSDSGSSSSSSSSSDSDAGSDSDSDSSEDEREARIAAVLNRDGTAASASAAELKLAKQLAKGRHGSRFGGRDGKMARIRQQEEQQAAAMRAKFGLTDPQPGAKTSVATAAEAGPSSSSKKDSKKDKKQGKRKQSLEEAAAAAAADGGSSGAGEDQSVDTAEGAVGSSKADSSSHKRKKQKKADSKAAGQQQQEDAAGQAAAAAVVAAAGSSKPKLVVVVVDRVVSNQAQESFASFKATPATGWWGAKMFTSAGLLEGLDQEQQGRKTFDEDMQTKVYMDAHNAQRQGRKGIGKSSTLKIASGGWKGTKVTFDEDVTAAEAASDDADTGTAASVPGTSQAAAQIGSGTSSGKADAADAGGAAAAAADRPGKKKVKWGSLAVRQLQQVPGGVLKWKKLWPLLLKAAEQQQQEQEGAGSGSSGLSSQSCKEKAWKKLQSCSRLQINGKLVTLAA